MTEEGTELQLPRLKLKLPLFVGVLKVHSPLCSIFTGRVIPLRTLVAVAVDIAQAEGGDNWAPCYLIPLELLTPEHFNGIVEWVARRYGVPLEEAKARVTSAPDFPVDKSHVAAAMAYKRKKARA